MARLASSGARGDRDETQSLIVNLFASPGDDFAVAHQQQAMPAPPRFPIDGVVDSPQTFVRVSDEALVNQNTEGTQYHSNAGQTATLANGDVVIVWLDSSGTPSNNNDVRARILTGAGAPQGADIFVHATTANLQSGARVAALPGGGFVVAWNDEGPPGLNGAQTDGTDGSLSGVVLRVFAANGTPVTGELLVNSATADNQFLDGITVLTNGNFLVTWSDNSQGVGGASGDSSGFAVKGQIYTAAGATIGSEFLVNQATSGIQAGSQVVPLASGTFALLWADFSAGVGGAAGDASGAAVKGRLFAANGAPTGNEFLVNTATVGNQQGLIVAKLADGGFVVGWQDSSAGVGGATGDSSGLAVKVQMFSRTGAKVGDEILVNSAVDNDQLLSGLVGVTGGGFVAVWRDSSMGVGGAGGDGSGTAVKAQLFAANGARIGGEILVNTATTGAQDSVRVIAIDNGGFVVTWSDASAGVGGATGDASGRAIKAQVFNAYGVPIGDELLVNSITDGDQTSPQITAVLSGGFAVNWQDASTGGNNLDIRSQVLGSIGSATADNDDIIGNPAANTIDGLGGDDTISGLGGNDILIGGEGNDRLMGGAGSNELYGGPGDDVFVIENAGDTIFDFLGGGTDTVETALAAYVLRGIFGEGPDVYIENLTGTSNSGQTLVGNALDNRIAGGLGDDEMQGGAGNDTYVVLNPSDSIIESSNQGVDTVETPLSVYVMTARHIEILVGTSNAGQVLVGGPETSRIVGGTGNDEMQGGAGNDNYVVLNAGDTIVEFANEGADTIETPLAAYVLNAANVENLTGTSNAGQALVGNSLNNRITGGTGNDELQGLGGDDTYVVLNAGDTIVEQPGGGSDTIETALAYYQLAAANVERLIGTSSTGQFLRGSDGNDAIFGGSGGDLLAGGLGADILNGGAGPDRFLFDTALGGGNVDHISFFVSGTDRIYLEDSIFTQLSLGVLPASAFVTGTSAQDADDRIIYDPTTGALYYDADGNGAAAAVQFALLAPGGTALAASDFVVI